MITFASPALLTLLVVVPALWWLLRRDERGRARRLALLVDAGLQASQVLGLQPQRRRTLHLAMLAAIATLVVAAAGPQLGGRTLLLPRKGLDILFVVDVSRSMRARDVQPDRLERAKAEIAAALPRLGENRVGIVAFAGTAFVQCPLTTDMEAVRLFLQDLRPESVPQGGTALVEGLDVALQAMRAEQDEDARVKESGRVVVVVTDGEDHVGGIEETAQELKAAGATVLLLGVGSSLGEPIPMLAEDGSVQGYVKDRAGNTVVTRMNPEAMQAVANAVGGSFVDGTTRPDLGMSDVEAAVARLDKRDLEARTRIDRVDRASLVAVLALVLLCATLVVPETSRRARRRKP